MMVKQNKNTTETQANFPMKRVTSVTTMVLQCGHDIEIGSNPNKSEVLGAIAT